jgi:precorrin-6A/cobalt-precorrin-6A reductase
VPDLILVLGGSAEGRALADAVPSVYSLAGRVAEPLLPSGTVRVGGFGGVDGLVAWLRGHPVRAVVDATHPFAEQMSRHAVQACAAVDVPLVRLQRPGWTAQPGDTWVRVRSLEAAAAAVGDRRVLLTTGRQEIGPFLGLRQVVVRAVTAPDDLPSDWVAVLGRPPWSLESERALLLSERIEVLVTKDSGGAASPKLQAARELGVEVVIVDRPPVLAADVVQNVEQALTWLTSLPTGARVRRGSASG